MLTVQRGDANHALWFRDFFFWTCKNVPAWGSNSGPSATPKIFPKKYLARSAWPLCISDGHWMSAKSTRKNRDESYEVQEVHYNNLVSVGYQILISAQVSQLLGQSLRHHQVWGKGVGSFDCRSRYETVPQFSNATFVAALRNMKGELRGSDLLPWCYILMLWFERTLRFSGGQFAWLEIVH